MLYKYAFINHLFDSLRALTYLSFGDSSASNPSWVQADMYQPERGQLKR